MIGNAKDSTILVKSLIYSKKSRGPKIELCGTPWVNFIHLDNVLMREP